MPDVVDEILAKLGLSDEEEAETPPEGDDGDKVKAGNKTIREMRAAIKKLGEENKELRTFKDTTIETQRTTTAKDVFKALELPEEQATLFLKNHEGEVTAEAVKQFVVDYKLPAKAEGVEGVASTDSKSEGFPPGGGADAGTQGPSKITRKELDDLIYSDPVRAGKMVDAGLVDYSAK